MDNKFRETFGNNWRNYKSNLKKQYEELETYANENGLILGNDIDDLDKFYQFALNEVYDCDNKYSFTMPKLDYYVLEHENNIICSDSLIFLPNLLANRINESYLDSINNPKVIAKEYLQYRNLISSQYTNYVINSIEEILVKNIDLEDLKSINFTTKHDVMQQHEEQLKYIQSIKDSLVSDIEDILFKHSETLSYSDTMKLKEIRNKYLD